MIAAVRPCFRLYVVVIALAVISAAGIIQAADDEVVVLPAFEVNGLRPWIYAEIPGYQVLSLSSESETRAFIERLQRLARLTPMLMPAGVETNFTARSTLFMRHFAGNDIVAKAGLKSAFRLQAYSIVMPDTSIVFPSDEASRNWSRGIGSAAIDFRRVSSLAPPAVPIWYRDGMAELLTKATSTLQGIEVPSRRWPKNLTADGASKAGAGGASVGMMLPELLALRPEGSTMTYGRNSLEERKRYLDAATAFVHWGFFGDAGRRRTTFLDFVAEASRGPIDENAFRRALGRGFAEAQVAIDKYASDGVSSIRLGFPPANLLSTPVLVRPATRSEVGRMIGESYFHLGQTTYRDAKDVYFGKARTSLENASAQGGNESDLFFQLGRLEQAEGKREAARRHLEQAVGAHVARPVAYVALARLRLGIGTPDSNRALTVTDAQEILQLLRTADTMRPRMAETYLLAAAVWRRSQAPLAGDDFAMLAAGVEMFPLNPTLLRSVLAVFDRGGWERDRNLDRKVTAWRARLAGFSSENDADESGLTP